MTLNDRLVSLADCWSLATGRSVATLGSKLVNDSRIIERLRSGSACTTTTADRFFVFFRTADNWPSNMVPTAVAVLLDGVDLGASHGDVVTGTIGASSSGITDEVTAAEMAA